MQYTTLGTSGVKVSRVCLGTMNFGSSCDQNESIKIMNRAIDLGINFFDCADFYGMPAGQGVSESIVGSWFKKSGKRDDIVLVTKAYATVGNMGVNDRGLSAYHLRRASNDSLKRLNTDHIDVYMMHHLDRGFRYPAELGNINKGEYDLLVGISGTLAPKFEEIIEAMIKLKFQDKISYIGSANFPAWGLAHFNAIAKEMNTMGTVVEQCNYNLNCRKVEIELLPACRELGIGVMAYAPLAAGLLAGYENLSKSVRFSTSTIDSTLIEKLKKYDKLCKEFGESPANVSQAWVLHNNVVTTMISGPRTVKQLEESVKALSIELPDDFVREIDTIWQGPNQEAPEYYGW